MDPQVVWSNLLIAWVSRDWEEVLELSAALLNWLNKDGFSPEFSYPQELGRSLIELSSEPHAISRSNVQRVSYPQQTESHPTFPSHLLVVSAVMMVPFQYLKLDKWVGSASNTRQLPRLRIFWGSARTAKPATARPFKSIFVSIS